MTQIAHGDGELAETFRTAALAWKDANKGRVIGYLGADVPPELIQAAGHYPVRLPPGQPPTPAGAGRFFERGDSDVIAEIAEPLLSGAYDFVDHVVVGNAPVFHAVLFNFLLEARRLDLPLPLSFSLHEMYHGGGEIAASRNDDACARLLALLGGASDAALRDAIDAGNARRAEIAALRTRRLAGRISGSAALTALTAFDTMPLTPLDAVDDEPSGPHLMFSGSDIDHRDHYALVEAAGCVITTDDHDRGDQIYSPMIAEDGDPLMAIAEAYAAQPPRNVRWPTGQRVASLVERAVAADVAGAVVWINDEDHASAWDLPPLKAALAQAGIPVLDLGTQPLRGYDAARITARVADWLPTLERTPR